MVIELGCGRGRGWHNDLGSRLISLCRLELKVWFNSVVLTVANPLSLSKSLRRLSCSRIEYFCLNGVIIVYSIHLLQIRSRWRCGRGMRHQTCGNLPLRCLLLILRFNGNLLLLSRPGGKIFGLMTIVADYNLTIRLSMRMSMIRSLLHITHSLLLRLMILHLIEIRMCIFNHHYLILVACRLILVIMHNLLLLVTYLNWVILLVTSLCLIILILCRLIIHSWLLLQLSSTCLLLLLLYNRL
jgi:hypothetical protein